MERSPDRPLGGVWTVVVAGGSGNRFGSVKQFEVAGGRRVVEWSVSAAATAGRVVVVVPDGSNPAPIDADITVTGGSTRAESVRRGLAVIPADASIILVHDAARPAATPDLFARVVQAVADGADAAVPGIAVVDTLRRRGGGGVERDGLVAVQTPQGFRSDVLRRAHATAGEATDDATLAERAGAVVVVVDGEPTNIKLTGPEDLAVLDATLVRRSGADA